MEQFIRDKFNIINLLTITSDMDREIDDYLRLFNFLTSEEEKEIKFLLETIIKNLERITAIQDECYSR